MEITSEKIFFKSDLQARIKECFYYSDKDHYGRKRLFFENAGGSLRLKAALEARSRYDMIPDCPERYHDIALDLKQVREKGISDAMEVIFGAKSGALVTELTASQVIFQITRTIIENVPGSNVVTTSIEHPSAFDSAQMYAERNGKEFRVARADPATGGVSTEEILRHIDKKTCLLSVMGSSNISGFIFDLEEIVAEARKINPELYIINDAVQHMPHGVLDVEKLKLDGSNFAPYKAFGIRGCGFGYVSDRVAKMKHNKLSAKPEMEWELGTFPHPNFAALSAIVDYVCWIGTHFTGNKLRRELFKAGMDQIHLHEHSLLVHMMEGTQAVPGLRHIPGVRVYCDSSDNVDRDLISAIGINGLDCATLRAEYYASGVTVFERVNTSLYSRRILEAIGLTGIIRVSPMHFHDRSDIEDFLRITAEIAAKHAQ